MRKINYKKLELLAPAGSFEAAKAAVNAGADAIYMGGPLFSARAYAESSRGGAELKMEGAGSAGKTEERRAAGKERQDGNANRASDRGAKAHTEAEEIKGKTAANTEGQECEEAPDQLLSAISYCHLRGVKVYMTLNILMKEQEMNGLSAYLTPYVRAGLDAVIVQDAGVFQYVRTHFPDLPIHVSTQMTVTGPYFAACLKAAGANRIVAARELSLEELGRIYDETGMELEAFIHGALCYSYSGQCLMSSALGGRSGNRGRCAGPCRLPYEVYDEAGCKLAAKGAQYFLSMKDLDTLERLPELIAAGVMSFKIEGRMKSPLYVAAVTSVYRKYLDQIIAAHKAHPDVDKTPVCPKIEETDRRLLREVFDRGGSTDGYLSAHNGRDMLALYEKPKRRIPDEQLLEKVRRTYLERDQKIPVRLYASLSIGMPPILELTACVRGKTFAVRVEGSAPVQTAREKGLSEEELLKRFAKLGNTDFTAEEKTVACTGDVFLPVGQINELRRRAADELHREILAGFNRNGGAVPGGAGCPGCQPSVS